MHIDINRCRNTLLESCGCTEVAFRFYGKAAYIAYRLNDKVSLMTSEDLRHWKELWTEKCETFCSISFSAEAPLLIISSAAGQRVHDAVTGTKAEVKADLKARVLSISGGRIFHEGKELDIKASGVLSADWDTDEESGLTFLVYSDGEGIKLAAGRGSHFVTFRRDMATYPDFGVVYEGDYYRPLPFSEYIHAEKLPSGDNVFDVRAFGAVPDPAILSTEAFRGAFEAAQAVGGTVLVTGGYYCVSELFIPSNTTLFVAIDSAITASKDMTDFRNTFIGIVESENVTVRGGGKFICNGEYFVYPPKSAPRLEPLEYIKLPPVVISPMGYPADTIRYAYRERIRYAFDAYGGSLPPIPRPMNNFWVRKSRNVHLENFIIEGAFEWTLNIENSDFVTVKDVVINDNRHVANSDGIDITGSRNVSLDHCFVSCADDGICLKSPKGNLHDDRFSEGFDHEMGPTHDVTVRNCTVSTVMNAFKIGTGTYYDITDVLVEDCRFFMPDIYPGSVSGISIDSADGAVVRNIVIRNILMEKVSCPIFICLSRRLEAFTEEELKGEKRYGGSIEKITIENIRAYDADIPSMITGFSYEDAGRQITSRVSDIQIRNIYVEYADIPEKLNILPEIHENITEYPECNSMGDVPAYGFYIRHAEKVTVDDYEIIPRTMNTRQCIVRDDA